MKTTRGKRLKQQHHLVLRQPVIEVFVALIIISAGLFLRTGLINTHPDATTPTVPANLALTSEAATSVGLSWAKATDNIAVTGYTVYRNGTAIGSSATNTYVDATRSPQTSYLYKVSASDATMNESSRSKGLLVATGDTVSPTAPRNLRQLASAISSLTIAWDAPGNNTSPKVYEVYRNGALVRAQTGTTFIDKDLQPHASYSYAVKSRDVSSNSLSSPAVLTATTATDTIMPSVPDSVRKTSANDITWNIASDNVKISGYRVYRNGAQVGSPKTNIFRDAGFKTGNIYTVSAVDSSNNRSAQSAPYTTTRLSSVASLAQPIDLHTTAIKSHTLNLSWDTSPDNDTVLGYKIYRDNRLVGISKTATFHDMGLRPATNYVYTIQAYGNANNVSRASRPLDTQTAFDAATLVDPTVIKQVTIIVLGADGTAQSGARVTLSNATATTNKDGLVTLNSGLGEQQITASYDGTTVHKSITVSKKPAQVPPIQLDLRSEALSWWSIATLGLLTALVIALVADALLYSSRLFSWLMGLHITPRRLLQSAGHSAVTTANPKRMASLPEGSKKSK